MKIVNMPPDAPTLMWSTRAIGYTTPAAVADLLDNSISANGTKIDIEFVSGDDAFISILDNGSGMTSHDLCLAMKYGSGNPLQDRSENDLGRFGLGLKTASLSQCRKLTVVSKKVGEISAYCWDLDHIFSVGQWDLLELEAGEVLGLPQIEKLDNYQEGTIVIWNNMDKIFAGNENKDSGLLEKFREVEEHLAITFHRFLQGEPGLKKVSMHINGIPIKPVDPFFTIKSDEMPTETIPIKYDDAEGNKKIDYVIVTPYILPFSDSLSQTEIDLLGGKEGLIKNQGFYIYRNKRLIVAADWFRLTRKTDLSKLCRVRVDIPNSLDEIWTIDVKKSMAIPPETILKNLRRIITPIIKTGKRKYKFRAVKESYSEGVKIWTSNETRNGMMYWINPEYPIYKELYDQITDKRKFQTFVRLIEQNIPVNAIHSDFYDDKKYAFEDVDVSFQNAVQNITELLREVKPEYRRDEFNDLMGMMPFSEYEIKFEDLGDIDNG